MATTVKEEFVTEDLLESAVEFTNSRQFRNAIADFIDAHVHKFYSTAESKNSDSNELPHEYNQVFTEYQQLVDNLFEILAQEKGFTTQALYRCFRDAGDTLIPPIRTYNLTLLTIFLFI